MEFLEVAGKTIQRPSLDPDDLTLERTDFKGPFDFSATHLRGGVQAGVVGEGSLSSVLVSSVDLSECRLDPLELSNVRLDDVDLSNAVLPSVTARRLDVLGCRGIGLSLDFVQAMDVYVQACRFDFATIRFEQVKNAVVFRRCRFVESILAGDLSNIIFDECEFEKVEFAAVRAAGCDLTTTNLIDVHGLSTLRGAKISADQASSLAMRFASEAGLMVVF
ncbi:MULTISPECIES: pentapeptide repeat-containing protein [Actinoalloteichus]|uniref:Pentapeptide repeat-containing protein n=1 Tax=Actinoalloteichus fjordicus TaxID=1612552 RepID=A0AAC9LJ82_9PSEU|nr:MULTISPECIES: hypothetical protein [Actinoalloteichus]APU17335.1 hypothetical protein UA74_26650 [Actinoalloteichus fjordicus]APU23419.1 hypothetical protein UA75_27240 [Actinoalloteichus sp. GBA129-24]